VDDAVGEQGRGQGGRPVRLGGRLSGRSPAAPPCLVELTLDEERPAQMGEAGQARGQGVRRAEGFPRRRVRVLQRRLEREARFREPPEEERGRAGEALSRGPHRGVALPLGQVQKLLGGHARLVELRAVKAATEQPGQRRGELRRVVLALGQLAGARESPADLGRRAPPSKAQRLAQHEVQPGFEPAPPGIVRQGAEQLQSGRELGNGLGWGRLPQGQLARLQPPAGGLAR
jgi:hypothetical protein